MTTGWTVTPTASLPCLLCGDDRDVSMALARFRDGTYEAIPRCKDAIACQRRVEDAGQTWDIDDRRAPR